MVENHSATCSDFTSSIRIDFRIKDDNEYHRSTMTSTITQKQVLISGIIQLVLGAWCTIFGIIERATQTKIVYTFTSFVVLAIWMGLWICITGGLGILAYKKTSFKALVSVFLGFSITSVVFAGIMSICYSISLVILRNEYRYYYNRYKQDYGVTHVMTILVIIVSVIEFGVGIWACICCCNVLSGQGSQNGGLPGQVVYLQTQDGGPPIAHIIIQGQDGRPVAVPALTGGPMAEPSGMPAYNTACAAPPHYEGAVYQPQQNEAKVPL